MNTLSRTLRLFLDSIGRRSEYEFYLKKFQSDRSACFALVLPDTPSIEESGDLMTFDLQFLMRLELCPLLVLAGPDAAKNAASLNRHGPCEVITDLSPESDPALWQERLKGNLHQQTLPVILMPVCTMRDAALKWVPALTKRLHVVRAEGMLRTTDGEEVFYWHTRRSEPKTLREEDLPDLNNARAWLEHDPQLHISISSPLYLLQEMFTVRGRGSIVRPGSEILHFTSLAEVDQPRLLELIEGAFGRSLRDPATLSRAGDFYIESRYRGAVILEPHPVAPYLSKFTVGTEARGEGVAQELWERACESQPRLFWRSRAGNPVNHWYERQANGHHQEQNWVVFWRGIEPDRLPEIISYALGRPSDFEES